MTREEVLQYALNNNLITEIPTSDKVQKALAQRIWEETLSKQDTQTGKGLSDDEQYYQELISDKVESGLPIPHEIEGDPPELPLDITQISGKEVRFLHGAFNACAARVGWLYSLEEAGQSAASQIANHLEDEYITSLGDDRKDFGGKSKTQALLKAEASRSNPDIVKWQKRERQHANAANKYKRLLDAYDNICDRLSREWTMRTDEKQHS